jgi:hypothetical protein
MSAPFVSGLVALMFELAGRRGRQLDIEMIRQVLTRTAAPLVNRNTDVAGAGGINAAAALDLLDLWLETQQPSQTCVGSCETTSSA